MGTIQARVWVENGPEVRQPGSPERLFSAVRLISSKHHFIDIRIRPSSHSTARWLKPGNADLRALSPFAKYEEAELLRCCVGRITTFTAPEWHLRRQFVIDSNPVEGTEVDNPTTIKAFDEDWSFEETVQLRPGPDGKSRKPIREKWIALSSAWNQTIVLSLVEVLPGKPTKSAKSKKPNADSHIVDCHDARGMVIRIGHYIQAAMVVNGQLTLERWSFSPVNGQGKVGGRGASEWQRLLRMGNDSLPCNFVMGGKKGSFGGTKTWESPVTVGQEHQTGRFVWRVIETETHADVSIPYPAGGRLPWLRNQARPNPDFLPQPIHSRPIDDINVEYDPIPEPNFELDPAMGEFISGEWSPLGSGCTSGIWHPQLKHRTRMRRAASIFMPPKDLQSQRRHPISAPPASPRLLANPSIPASPSPIKSRPQQQSRHPQSHSHSPTPRHQPPPQLPPYPVQPSSGAALSTPSFPPGVVPPSTFIHLFPFPPEPSLPAPSSTPRIPPYGRYPPPYPYPDFIEEAEKVKYWSPRLPLYLDWSVQNTIQEFRLPASCRSMGRTQDWIGCFATRAASPQPEKSREKDELHDIGVPKLFGPLLFSLAIKYPTQFTESERLQLHKLQKASSSSPPPPLVFSEVSTTASLFSYDDPGYSTHDDADSDDEFSSEGESDEDSVVFIIPSLRPTSMFKCFRPPHSPEAPEKRLSTSANSSPRPVKKEDRSIPIMDPTNGHFLFESHKGRPRASTTIGSTPPPNPLDFTDTPASVKAMSASPPIQRRSLTVERHYPSPAPSSAPSDTGIWTDQDEIAETLDNIDLAIRASAWSVNGELVLPTNLAKDPEELLGSVEAKIDRSGLIMSVLQPETSSVEARIDRFEVITSAVQPETPSVEELRRLAG